MELLAFGYFLINGLAWTAVSLFMQQPVFVVVLALILLTAPFLEKKEVVSSKKILFIKILAPIIFIGSSAYATMLSFGCGWGGCDYGDEIWIVHVGLMSLMSLLYLVLLVVKRYRHSIYFSVAYFVLIVLALLFGFVNGTLLAQTKNVCGVIDLYFSDYQAANCYEYISVKYSDPELCKKAGPDAYCHAELAEQFGAEYDCPVGDTWCQARVAQKENDLERCDALPENSMPGTKGACYSRIAAQRQDASICFGLNLWYDRKNCLLWVYRETQDVELCKYFNIGSDQPYSCEEERERLGLEFFDFYTEDIGGE